MGTMICFSPKLSGQAPADEHATRQLILDLLDGDSASKREFETRGREGFFADHGRKILIRDHTI